MICRCSRDICDSAAVNKNATNLRKIHGRHGHHRRYTLKKKHSLSRNLNLKSSLDLRNNRICTKRSLVSTLRYIICMHTYMYICIKNSLVALIRGSFFRVLQYFRKFLKHSYAVCVFFNMAALTKHRILHYESYFFFPRLCIFFTSKKTIARSLTSLSLSRSLSLLSIILSLLRRTSSE